MNRWFYFIAPFLFLVAMVDTASLDDWPVLSAMGVITVQHVRMFRKASR